VDGANSEESDSLTINKQLFSGPVKFTGTEYNYDPPAIDDDDEPQEKGEPKAVGRESEDLVRETISEQDAMPIIDIAKFKDTAQMKTDGENSGLKLNTLNKTFEPLENFSDLPQNQVINISVSIFAGYDYREGVNKRPYQIHLCLSSEIFSNDWHYTLSKVDGYNEDDIKGMFKPAPVGEQSNPVSDSTYVPVHENDKLLTLDDLLLACQSNFVKNCLNYRQHR
jgi:hypothetical protein